MPSVAEEKLMALLKRLIYATESSRISWSVSADLPDGYQYNASNSSVTVSSKDGDGTWPFVIELFDESGRPVEKFLTSFSDEYGEGYEAPYNTALQRLHELARRQARNIDGIYDALFRDLPAPPA